MVKQVFIAAAALAAMGVGSANAALISYYNFNALSIATASAPGSGGVPTSISANSGSGTLSLSGWSGLVDDFGGSTINALNSDAAEESLSLVSNAGNGSFVQLQFSTAGLEDIIVTFATRGTSTGYNSGLYSYSTDGTNFTQAGVPSTATISTTFALATADLSSISAIDDQSSVFVRYTLAGASSVSGNNRIDNLQINGTVIPEPASLGLIGVGALALLRRRRSTVA